jgi:hypothetical protein
MTPAKIADAIQVTEKIKSPGLRGGGGLEDATPDSSGIGSADRLAIFVGFDELEANRANVGTQVERLDFEQVHLLLLEVSVGKLFLKIGGLLAEFKPVEKCVGSFKPDAEPVRDFFFFGALGRFYFVIAGNHLGATAAQTSNLADALGGGALAFDEKFSQKLIEADEAHLSFVEGGEVQQIGELLFIAALGIGASGHDHAQACFFEHADDIVRGSFSLCAEMRNELAANLLDLSGSKARLGEALRDFEDHRFFGG